MSDASQTRSASVPGPGRDIEPLLDARQFSKTFGVSCVLKDVDISVRRGEVRGLVGQNGSGKSTFIKLLSGVYELEAGAQLWIRGREVSRHAAANRGASLGLGVMHQDLGLEPSMSVLDNFLLNAAGSPLRRIRWAREKDRVRDAIEAYGLEVDVRRPVGDLSRGESAVVALARAFERIAEGFGVLVLDEPTASLEDSNAQALFTAIRATRDRGCGVLLVSHDLAEIRRVCDTVSVLRDGALVASGDVADFSERDLIRAVVGKDIGALYPAQPTGVNSPAVLTASNIRGRIIRDLSLELHEGEVVGLTGLAGMGQDEVPGLLYGAEQLLGGRVALFGKPYRPRPKESMARGVILLPADRRSLGGDPETSVADNLTLPIARRYYRRARMDRNALERDVRRALEAFDVRPPHPQLQFGHLSGGNQQKALLAKWLRLFGMARVLLLHEPTQGVDIAARQDIFRMIRESVATGATVLYVSTELEDLAHLCDRVIVVRHGQAVAEFARPHLTATALAVAALASQPQGSKEAISVDG